MRFSSQIALGLGLLVLSGAGCSRPGYVVDFFPEMHYQQSFRPQEPPRLYPPAQSVPVTGKEIPYNLSEAASLQNPIVASPPIKEQGARLFRINCAACHGPNGVSVMPGAPHLARGERMMQPDMALLGSLKAGKNAMPAYIGILADKEILDVIAYSRTLHQ